VRVRDANRGRIETLARDVLPREVRSALQADLEAARSTPIPGIDGIDSWGPRAAEFVGAFDEGGLRFTDTGGPHAEVDAEGFPIPALIWDEHGARATAFHERDALVADVSGFRDLKLRNDESPTSAQLDAQDLSFCEFRSYTPHGVEEGDIRFRS